MSQQNDELVNFFKQVNKIRIKIKKAENPMDSYEEFKDSEKNEDIIRKGMSQYEDLVTTLKRLKSKKSEILEQLKRNPTKNVNENISKQNQENKNKIKNKNKTDKEKEKEINTDPNIIYTKLSTEPDEGEKNLKEKKKSYKEKKKKFISSKGND